tara:strand:+ start:55 stop:246 length:192 start_codon:yes stop_codon:yes gene_type:complete
MKRHQFFFEFLPNTILCGLSISQYETKIEESDEWHPTFRLAIGLIFVTFSYTKIFISEDNSVS